LDAACCASPDQYFRVKPLGRGVVRAARPNDYPLQWQKFTESKDENNSIL